MESQLEADRKNFDAELDKWVQIKLEQIEKERKKADILKFFVTSGLSLLIGLLVAEYLEV